MLKMQKWKKLILPLPLWQLLSRGKDQPQSLWQCFLWAIGTLETYMFTWGGAHLFSQPMCMITYDNRASVLLGTLSLHPDCQEIVPSVTPLRGPTHRIMLELVCYSFHILVLVRRSWQGHNLNSQWSFDFRRALAIYRSLEFGQLSTSCWLFKDYAE